MRFLRYRLILRSSYRFVRRHYCYCFCFAALFSLAVFEYFKVLQISDPGTKHSEISSKDVDSMKVIYPDSPGTSNMISETNIQIKYDDLKRKENSSRKQEVEKIKIEKEQKMNKTDVKPEKINSLIGEMILRGLMEKHKRRYDFKNVDETVYRTVKDIPRSCGHQEFPVKFSKSFKNFCWFENDCGCNSEPSLLRCLPYFHLIGFPKCGTSDLFRRIEMHPHVLSGKKETNYWSSARFMAMGNETERMRTDKEGSYLTYEQISHLQNASVISTELNRYLDFHIPTMRSLETQYQNGENTTRFILGEGSVTYVYSSLGLKISIAEALKISPKDVDCSVAKILRWLTPDAKIIISVRDPVERLYSDYKKLFNLLLADEKSPEDFHYRVLKSLKAWKECTRENTIEVCATSPQFESLTVHNKVLGLSRSMYVIHIRKWLEVFPRKQFFILSLEERLANEMKFFKKILDFLELDSLPEEQLKTIVTSKERKGEKENARPHQQVYGKPMLKTTKKLLQDFYRPFNRKLAELLNNDLYLWYDRRDQ